MRIYRPLLSTLRKSTTTSSISPSSSSTNSPAWLSSLKASQLQHLAFLTGVSSSGTKNVLIERLSQGLAGEPGKESDTVSDSSGDAPARVEKEDGRMSILSIDMGIRNLAYAHLIVNPPVASSASKGSKKAKLPSTESWDVVLNAWNRLAISSFQVEQTENMSEIAVASLEQFNGGNASTQRRPRRNKSRQSQSTEREEPGAEEGESLPHTASKEAEKESFAPHIYASHAYTLITSLIAAYKPTHILIERQRFRSGGGSAVQEWTIRVGVFEGMLYAVLQTLKRESRRGRRQQLENDVGVEDICVLGVEPQRVAKYWAERVKDPVAAIDKGKRGKGKMSSKEGKRAKIDAVGSLISAGTDSSSDAAELASTTRSVDKDGVHVRVGGSAQVKDVVTAFIDKWDRGDGRRRATSAPRIDGNDDKSSSGGRTKEKVAKRIKPKGENGALEVGKLDDLADSLLQGLTWLAWRDMRVRIAKEGRKAVPFE